MMVAGLMHLHAQYPYVEIIGHEKGFGKSNISCLLEDHQGVIWAGTQLGLLRYDGLRTDVFLPGQDDHSITNEFIYDLLEDQCGNIWVASRHGLSRIDPSRKHITRYYHDPLNERSLPGNRIYQLHPFTDSTVFVICGKNGLATANIFTGEISRMPLQVNSELQAENNGFATPYDAFTLGDGGIYFKTNAGFYLFDAHHLQLVDVRDTCTAISDISFFGNYVASRDGDMWFTDFEGHIFRWKPFHYLEPIDVPMLVKDFRLGQFAMIDFDDKHMMVSNDKGYYLVHKDEHSVRPFGLREEQDASLSVRSIEAVTQTRNGIIILGTTDGRLLLIDPLLQHFRFKKIIPHDSPGDQLMIGDIFNDARTGKRYISAIQDSFFYVEDLWSGQVKQIKKPLVYNSNNKWLKDSSGRLWLCDGTGILEISDEGEGQKRFSPNIPVKNIFEMVEVASGRFLAATFFDGLYVFIPDQQVFYRYPDQKGWKLTQINSIKADIKRQSVWISTSENGAYRYDISADTFYQYTKQIANRKSIGGDYVRDITIDSSGYVWLAVDPGGLSRFDYHDHPDSAFITLSREHGLPTNFISGLSTDVHGAIWMTSLNGLAKLDPATFEVSLYGKTDGLSKTRFSRSGITITTDNDVLIPARTGYFSFRPDKMHINRMPPDLIVRDIQVFNQSKWNDENMAGQPVRLSYKENYITFGFSVINLTEPEQNTVRYMLEGFDEDWTYKKGISEVSYTKIPPGEYIFRISAANNDGIWNVNEKSIPIRIIPPFWQRTWFYILVGLWAAGMIFWFYTFKLKQTLREKLLIAEKQRIQSESERLLAELEMKALRAQMNPHFIFNCLNSINRFIVVNDNESASEYLTKFARLIRQVLDNSRGEKVNLATEIDTLKLYIDMEALRFHNKFDFRLDMEPGLNAGEFMIQPMLIQPYAENAIWHGLMHRKTKGMLTIRFSRVDHSLLVSIEDDGIGRAHARQIRQHQVIQRKSHGMKVTAERMSILSKQMNVPVTATIIDLYDASGEPSGTRVELTLPVEPAESSQSVATLSNGNV